MDTLLYAIPRFLEKERLAIYRHVFVEMSKLRNRVKLNTWSPFLELCDRETAPKITGVYPVALMPVFSVCIEREHVANISPVESLRYGLGS